MNIYDVQESETDQDYFSQIERGMEIVSNTSENRYVIINEIRKNAYSITYSAIKIQLSESFIKPSNNNNKKNTNNQINNLENQKFMVKFYRRDLIEEYIISKLSIRQSAKESYYEDLLKEFKNSQADATLRKMGECIQRIFDIEINENGVFVVTEFNETTLAEYLRYMRESFKSNKCAELKYKHVFLPVLELVYNLDYKVSFSGLLNSSDIYVNEKASGSAANNSNDSFIKITHPFFNQLETVFKILDNENFPNFYPPQFIAQFKQEPQSGKVLMQCTDLSDALALINHNFDMWALGYLLYEILFEILPFKFENLEKAKFAFWKNKVNYKIKRNKYTKFIIDVITNSMKWETEKRLNLRNVKIQLYKETIGDDKNFEILNLKYLINPEKYKENEEENVFIREEKD